MNSNMKSASFLPNYSVYPAACLDSAHFQEYWKLLKEAKTAPAVFFSATNPVSNATDLECLARSAIVVFYGLYHEQTPLGFAWLNNFNGLSANAHFAGFRAAFGGHGINVGLKFCHTVLTTLSGLTTLTGITPATHHLALRFIRTLGFVRVGVVPEVLVANGRLTDAVVSYCNLNTLNTKEARV